MGECDYNYELEDNLAASKYLFKVKNKRKTNIVTLLVVAITIFGVMVSIGAIIQRNNNWAIGLASILLIVAYFMVDKIALWSALKKQKEYFLSSNLSKVTKVKVLYDKDTITETFFIKEKILGSNFYSVNDLTSIKIEKDYIFLVFKEEYVLLLKKQCMTDKSYLAFANLKEILVEKNKKVKKNKK